MIKLVILIITLCINIAYVNNAIADPTGKIKVCRRPGIFGLMDGKQVDIPAGTYTGTSDKNGDNSRNIVVSAPGATLGKNQHACVILSATLTQSDGKPLNAGEELITQWSVPGFEPLTKVIANFK